jgi:hypothetical protein
MTLRQSQSTLRKNVWLLLTLLRQKSSLQKKSMVAFDASASKSSTLREKYGCF